MLEDPRMVGHVLVQQLQGADVQGVEITIGLTCATVMWKTRVHEQGNILVLSCKTGCETG